jgi:hypothetical protein
LAASWIPAFAGVTVRGCGNETEMEKQEWRVADCEGPDTERNPVACYLMPVA